uniref:Integrator complex subunit 15 n=1 Tax=Electrophorus electricus TaxID=8005 RepID=A0A4W4FL53_ELEEL
MSDIRHALLRRDPLSAAKEVLYHLDISLGSALQSASGPASGLEKSTVDLVEEFIFHIHPHYSVFICITLNFINCSYAVRQVIFSALFSLQGNKADESRMAMLSKLVSMAIAVCRVPILECAATWLQRTHSAWCVRLARALVDDYCALVPCSIATLQNICSASPRFCCQLITAVTALYDFSSDELTPPPALLEMVVGWIAEDPRLLLLTFINTPLTSSLPIGCLEVTPLMGLLRWCVKAPLAYQRGQKLSLTNNQAETDKGMGCEELYSKLHLSILQVFLMLQVHLTEQNLFGRLAVLQVESAAALIEEVSRLSDELNPLHAANQIQLALDRLAQAVQVAMATGALLCTRVLVFLFVHFLLQLVMSGPVVSPPHGSPFQPSPYTYVHPARPSPLSPLSSAHAALSPLHTHPALSPHRPLVPHSTHSSLGSHAFHPAAVAFPYRPIR